MVLPCLFALLTLSFAATFVSEQSDDAKKLIRSAKKETEHTDLLEAEEEDKAMNIDIAATGAMKARPQFDFSKGRLSNACEECTDCSRAEKKGDTCMCMTATEKKRLEDYGAYAVPTRDGGNTDVMYDDFCNSHCKDIDYAAAADGKRNNPTSWAPNHPCVNMECICD